MLKQLLNEIYDSAFVSASKEIHTEIEKIYNSVRENVRPFKELFELNPILPENTIQKVAFKMGKEFVYRYKIGDGKTEFRKLDYVDEDNSIFDIIKKIAVKNIDIENITNKEKINCSPNNLTSSIPSLQIGDIVKYRNKLLGMVGPNIYAQSGTAIYVYEPTQYGKMYDYYCKDFINDDYIEKFNLLNNKPASDNDIIAICKVSNPHTSKFSFMKDFFAYPEKCREILDSENAWDWRIV